MPSLKRSDPAPSRLSYRIQRWMLTPGIRLGLKVGVPVCLVAIAGGAFLADADRRDALIAEIAEMRASIEQRPEFMVKLMAIDGAGPKLAGHIRTVSALDFPISSFDLDLDRLRAQVAELSQVRSVAVRVRPGGILQVDVVERQPVVVWRTRSGVRLLDESGAHIDTLPSRAARSDLPLIAGEGADKRVEEALALITAARPLGDRLRGLVRIGKRRWDVVLDRDQRIQLPSERPVPALERVLAVNEVQDLLERDVAVVDMRLSQRPTVRMTENANREWWRIKTPDGDGH
ncbi:cell division protein FtsQ [Cribrihabitans marinus]|uniref:Cell division protein FtsQ n=1 Tax=Cribrihabitans marinus TaxID=1227549 RepID=A0A1H6ZNG9_9RHOB|nr:cell division protein FtsQ/DivIB [Cribrihabitans marinus]GGH30277.1 cell division protein FtsQ [Cribrihabitans marinus]SEJ54969.1 cell division protein FtsQ [Cribrihabitans marinus]